MDDVVDDDDAELKFKQEAHRLKVPWANEADFFITRLSSCSLPISQMNSWLISILFVLRGQRTHGARMGISDAVAKSRSRVC